MLDAFDPTTEHQAVWNEEYRDWNNQLVQLKVPNGELDLEEYVILLMMFLVGE